MAKELTKHGNSVALMIDKPILDMFKMDVNTRVELSVFGGKLLVEVVSKKRRDEKWHKIAQEVAKEYAPVLKKLAKT